jgi:hypothetical protein
MADVEFDRLEALAAIDVAQAFTPFNPAEAYTLGEYSKLCGRFARSSLLSRKSTFRFKATEDEVSESFDYAGWEPLRSAMVDFRRLWLTKEHTRFQNVRKLLSRHARERGTNDGQDVVRALREIFDDHQEACRQSLMGLVDPEALASPEVWPEIRVHITAAQVIDHWLYGDAFHGDPEHQRFVESWSPATYEYTLLKAVTGVARHLWELDVLVQGILRAPTLLPPEA